MRSRMSEGVGSTWTESEILAMLGTLLHSLLQTIVLNCLEADE